MYRRTAPVRSLPMIKLALIASRQLSKPLVKNLVNAAKHHPVVNATCVALGRLSFGTSSLLFRWGQVQKEEAKTAAAAVEKAEEMAEGVPPGSSPPNGVKRTAKEEEDYAASLALKPKPLEPRKRRIRITSHFNPPVPESVLRDAGAELLVEIGAYLLAILIFWYEWRHSTRVAKEKEEKMELRLMALEDKVNQLTAKHPEIEDLKAVTLPKKPSWFSYVASTGAAVKEKIVHLSIPAAFNPPSLVVGTVPPVVPAEGGASLVTSATPKAKNPMPSGAVLPPSPSVTHPSGVTK